MKHATLFIEASDNLVEVARITEHEKKRSRAGHLAPTDCVHHSPPNR